MYNSESDPIAELNLALNGTASLQVRKRPIFPASWRSFRPVTAEDSQKKRREEALARYKQAHHQMLIKSRKIMNAFEQADTAAQAVDMEVAPTPTTSNDREKSPPRVITAAERVDRAFSHNLMMPEFLHDVPSDFEEGWLCTPFPEGTRCILVAKGGKTEARDVEGFKLDEFQSLLPGGSGFHNSDKPIHTVLDCIQVEAKEIGSPDSAHRSVYFVLDVLSWNGKFYYNSDAETRFWMKENWINDLEGLRTIEKKRLSLRNDRLILSLPVFDVLPPTLSLVVSSQIKLDIEMPEIQPQGMQTEQSPSDSSAAAHLGPSHIEASPYGIMFYFKEMDYIGEQTPVMCVLPIDDAKRLADERSNTMS